MKAFKLNQFHIRLLIAQSAVVMVVLLVFSLVVTFKFSMDAKRDAYADISYRGEVLKQQILLELSRSESVIKQLAYTYEKLRPSDAAWDDQVQQAIEQNPIITQIYLMDMGGMQFYKSSFPETLGNRADRDYFKTAVTGKSAYSDVIISRSTLKPIVVYALPIHDGERIIGVIGASINLDFLSDLVWQGQVEPTEADLYGFIVDSQGRVIAHPLADYVSASLDLSELKPVKSAIEGKKGTGSYFFDKKEKLVAYEHMAETNWGILVQIPENVAYAQLYSFLMLVGIVFIVIAALSFLLAYGVSGYFKQPVSEVVQLINVFRMQRDIPKQCSLRDDEFGMIQDAFIEMAETVLLDQQLLEARVVSRTKELTEALNLLLETQGELEASNHELQVTLTELNLAQEQLVQNEKMAALGRMANNFAHEVNTPLGTALTVIDLNERTLIDFKALLTNDSNNLELMQETIADLMDMSLLIRKQLITVNGLVETMVKTDFVNAFISESHEMGLKKYFELHLVDLQSMLSGTKHQLLFSTDVQDTTDLNYKDKLTQILKILIQNSLQHGFEATDSGEINIALVETEKGLRLNYRDNGKNLSEDELKKVFEPYYKGKMSGIGKGLGLTIVYTLVVHFMNGTISCHNVSPMGLAYEIYLPRYAK